MSKSIYTRNFIKGTPTPKITPKKEVPPVVEVKQPLAKTIDNGDYNVASTTNVTTKNITQGKKDGLYSPLTLENSNVNDTQRLSVEYSADKGGYYTIKNLATGASLNAIDMTTNPYPVFVDNFTGDNLQTSGYWRIVSSGGGSYNILNKNGDIALTLASNGVLSLKKYNSSDTTQRFVLNKPTQKIPNGDYSIESNRDDDSYVSIENGSMDNRGNVALNTWEGKDSQKFEFTYQNSGNCAGSYRIKVLNSGRQVDVSGGVKSEGANIFQWQSNGGANQCWKLNDVAGEEGTYKFINVNSNLALTADDKGTNITQKSFTNSVNQKFKLHETSEYLDTTEELPPIAPEAPANAKDKYMGGFVVLENDNETALVAPSESIEGSDEVASASEDDSDLSLAEVSSAGESISVISDVLYGPHVTREDLLKNICNYGAKDADESAYKLEFAKTLDTIALVDDILWDRGNLIEGVKAKEVTKARAEDLISKDDAKDEGVVRLADLMGKVTVDKQQSAEIITKVDNDVVLKDKLKLVLETSGILDNVLNKINILKATTLSVSASLEKANRLDGNAEKNAADVAFTYQAFKNDFATTVDLVERVRQVVIENTAKHDVDQKAVADEEAEFADRIDSVEAMLPPTSSFDNTDCESYPGIFDDMTSIVMR
jgi:hypothetical protein